MNARFSHTFREKKTPLMVFFHRFVATFGSSGHYKCEAVNDAGSDRKDISLLVLGELHYHNFPQWDRQKMSMLTTRRNTVRSCVSDNITEIYFASLCFISTIFIKVLVRYVYI
jgi:hypothetical protein